MKVSSPALMPFLRTDIQGEILAMLLLNPHQEWTVSELARTAHTSVPTVSREVERLHTAGYLTRRESGRNRYVRADTSHALYWPLREIIEYAYGPGPILTEALTEVSGVENAYIYGSWAARREGIEGADPVDIDVLIIGEPDRAALEDATQDAQRRLRREVNFQIISPHRWHSSNEPFLQGIRSRPLIELELPRGNG